MSCNCKRTVNQPSRHPVVRKPKDKAEKTEHTQISENNEEIYKFYGM